METTLRDDPTITMLVNNAAVAAVAPLLNADVEKMEEIAGLHYRNLPSSIVMSPELATAHESSVFRKLEDEDRIKFYLVAQFEDRLARKITREELQSFLDEKAASLSFSTVDHLKWDLVAIFRFAVAEGITRRNVAELQFTPRECKKSEQRVMNSKEVNQFFKVLELRERLIVKFAVLGGMRPGEIFALRRGRVTSTYANVSQRVYRGDLDTPKTHKSIRLTALSGGLVRDLEAC